MSTNRLSRWMKIEWNGIEFQIEERLSNGKLRLINKHTEERRIVEEILLIEAHSDGSLKILGQNNENQNLEQKIQKSHVYDFTALDESDPRKKECLRKKAYVKEMFQVKKAGFSAEELCEIIIQVSERIDDPHPPSTRALRRWGNSFIDSGEDIRGLVNSDKSKGNYARKFTDDPVSNELILDTINNCINEIYLTTQQNSIQAVVDLVEYRIDKINEHRKEYSQLPIPSYRAIYQIISQLDEYEVDKARKGERYANEKHKTLQKGPEPTRPLERVECDDTKTDLLVVDPVTFLALGRPWLMILVDCFTKMILGYFLSFYPPSHVTVAMAMKHAIRPKRYVKDKYPGIINSWDAYGLIEVLVIDNAKHWYGIGLEDACYQTGTDMQYAPVRIPWYKGSIESLLRTIHKSLIHKQPGTTFSNIFDKGDYDPEKHAVVWLDLLDEILHKWIIDVYSQSVHSGIKDIPARRWENSIVKFPPALPPAHTDLDIIFGKVAYRTISGTVINFQNLEYSDPVLATIKTNSKKDEKVKIKYDPTDLGVIYVYDAFWCRFVPVPAVDQEYAKGLTEWQHEVICKFIRRTNQARIDRKALMEAKEYIRQRIAEELGRRPKKLKNASGIAKWLAFEDPAEAKIIYYDQKDIEKSKAKGKSNRKPNGKSNGESQPLLSEGNKFILPEEQTDTPIKWNEGDEWESLYADFDNEEDE